jgi:Helix-turn-helix domain./Probable transposase.
MKIRRTYKYRIYPNREQKSLLEKWLETCRVLYNDCLTERRDAWQSCKKSINYYDQSYQIKKIRTFDSDIKSIYSQVVQDVLRRVDKAFENFFRRIKRRKKQVIRDTNQSKDIVLLLILKMDLSSMKMVRS